MKVEKEERKEEKIIEREESKAATQGQKDGVAGTSLDAEVIGKSQPSLFCSSQHTNWNQRLGY